MQIAKTNNIIYRVYNCKNLNFDSNRTKVTLGSRLVYNNNTGFDLGFGLRHYIELTVK